MTDWPFFPEVDQARMEPEFLDKLVAMRVVFNRPMPVTSSYRSPEKNDSVGGVKNSAHTQGRAVDISIWGEDALWIVEHARSFGFTGIGVRQHGPRNKRIIHLDDLPNDVGQPRAWLWSYPK